MLRLTGNSYSEPILEPFFNFVAPKAEIVGGAILSHASEPRSLVGWELEAPGSIRVDPLGSIRQNWAANGAKHVEDPDRLVGSSISPECGQVQR